MEQRSEELPIWRPAEPDPSYEAPSPVKEDRGLFKRIGAGLAALGALIAKAGAQLKFLLLLLPKAKLFVTAGSMLVSVGAYALLRGCQFRLGRVLLLPVHEMGHAIELRRQGMKATAPVFIAVVPPYSGR